jgi:hypothetical protein
MTHRTHIDFEDITVSDVADGERQRVIVYRVYCQCGFVSPVPLLTQTAANISAREHREAFSDGPRLRME